MEDSRFAFRTVSRCARVGLCGVAVAYDYKTSLQKLVQPPPEADSALFEEYLKKKSELHKRNAERVLDVMKKNGGVYIKLVWVGLARYTDTCCFLVF